MKRTDCECSGNLREGQATFWCKRHHCKKTAHFHHLCQTDPNYFRLWEKERGPWQDQAAEAKPRAGSPSPPALLRRAWSLTQALADFVADGCKTVAEEQYRHRLEICDGCGQRRNNRCMKCGCRLSLKARGRAFRCPSGKWPEV